MAAPPIDHLSARAILVGSFRRVLQRDATVPELDWTGAVASLETGYGRAGQFGQLAAQGFFNWGALEHAPGADGSCPPGTKPGSDAGNSRCFYVEQSDAAAADALVKTLLQSFPKRASAIAHAMNEDAPDGLDVALAMTTPPAYFEAAVPTYAKGLAAQYATIRAARNAPASPGSGPPRTSAGSVAGGALVLLFGAGFVLATLGIRKGRAT